MTLDWPDEVAGRLLALGGALEIVDPPGLRAEVAAVAAEVLARHAGPVRAAAG